MAATELEELIGLLSRLPGLGPRSARRAALHLVRHKAALTRPLVLTLEGVLDRVRPCSVCGNLDAGELCRICADAKRDPSVICVVEEVEDLWSLERARVFRGRYHVLGGTLKALDGIRPEDLRIQSLIERLEREPDVAEVVLALGATVEGQTTAHYLLDRLGDTKARVTGLARGVPLGGQLSYLDDGTLGAAFKSRRPVASGPG